MKTITVQQFCIHYKVPDSFIESLSKYDLITIIKIEKMHHIPMEQISNIERLIRLHYDLKINFEGLDVINNLINQINKQQEEITFLSNKLEFYKEE